MPDLDALAPNYRRARERWPDAPTLSRCHEALSTCFNGNAHGMVEYVKSFIESICVTILAEFREPLPSSTPSTTDLLVAALRPLGLQNTKGASKLDKVLSGFNRLTDALTEMRNDHGTVAHGKDAFLDAVTVDHARAFLHTGDAILGVLLNALEGKEPDLTVTREPYERFPHLNERIDRAVRVGVRIDEDGEHSIVVVAVATGPLEEAIELRVEPSRLLFGIDRAAYIEVLKTSVGVAAELEEKEPAPTSEEVEQPDFAIAPASPPLAEVIPSYTGRLATLRPAFEAFLRTEGGQPAHVPASSASLADSMLATADQNMGLDWKQREALQARLRIAFKRVLVRFGFEAKNADEVAGKVLAWMRIQVPDGDDVGPEIA